MYQTKLYTNSKTVDSLSIFSIGQSSDDIFIRNLIVKYLSASKRADLRLSSFALDSSMRDIHTQFSMKSDNQDEFLFSLMTYNGKLLRIVFVKSGDDTRCIHILRETHAL